MDAERFAMAGAIRQERWGCRCAVPLVR